jgi:Reverse transcriptase (RNA-dependent DNA polymerase)
LKILKNIYEQKQAGRTWAQHLKKGLLSIGFTQSEADECIFFRGPTIFMVYVDDGIFISPKETDIDKCIKDMNSIFNLTDEGDISDYLGIKVERGDTTVTLSQPHLIASILSDLNFASNTKTKGVPALSSSILQRDTDGPDFDEHWSYRSVIGKLNFLEKSTRPDIAYAVHQCARFSAHPKASHASAVRQIVRYLAGTPTQGLILSPNEHSFVVWADADFCGNWNKETSVSDIMTAKSRSGYAITYANCPIYGHPNYRRKLLYPLRRPSTSASASHFSIPFP